MVTTSFKTRKCENLVYNILEERVKQCFTNCRMRNELTPCIVLPRENGDGYI